jgi:hypothetical protein
MFKSVCRRITAVGLAATLPFSAAADAYPEGSSADLAQELSNPLASIISLPLQYNYDQGIGPNGNGRRNQLTFQPVYPFDLGNGATLIPRMIMPMINLSSVTPDSGNQYGIGDTLLVAWYVPNLGRDDLNLGFGPAVQVPGSSKVSSGTWAAGVTALGVYTNGPWTMGMNLNHIWDVESDPSADINRTFMQPFVAYSTPNSMTDSLQAEAAYDWETEEWAVPVTASVSKLVMAGRLPLNLTAGAGYWVDSPAFGPEGWRFRLQAQVVLPRNR